MASTGKTISLKEASTAAPVVTLPSARDSVLFVGDHIITYLETVYGDEWFNLTDADYKYQIERIAEFIEFASDEIGLATFLVPLQDLTPFIEADSNISYTTMASGISISTIESALVEIAVQNATLKEPGGFDPLIKFFNQRVVPFILSGEDKEKERLAEEKSDLANLDTSACEPDDAVADEAGCQSCTPNPNALVPNWTTVTQEEPFFNERTCEYSVAIQTNYTSTGGSALQLRLNEQIEPALKALIEYYDKATTTNVDGVDFDTLEILKPYAVVADYAVDTRPLIKMKVLITMPAVILNSIADAEVASGTDAESAGDFPHVVTLKASEVHGMLRRAARALEIYGKYQAVWQSTGGGTIKNVNLNEESKRLSFFKAAFGDFIKKNDYSFRQQAFSSKNDIENIEIGFADDYSIEYVKVQEPGCEYQSIKKGLTTFKKKDPMNWPTTMGFIAKLPDMDIDITARSPLPWLDFITKYVFPTPEIVYGQDANNAEETILSCLSENAAKEIKQFGQELLDEVFNLPDAIAFSFNQELCKTFDRKREEDFKLENLDQLKIQARDAIVRSYNVGDPLLEELPERLAKLASEGSVSPEKLWAEIFDPLGACGLLALLQVALECLLKGIPRVQALDMIVAGAVRSMSVDFLEKLMFSLPVDKQAEVRLKVIEQIGPHDEPWFEGSERSRVGEITIEAVGTVGKNAGTSLDLVADAYRDAIIELVGADILIEELNKLPGAELVSRVIAKLSDCPNAPFFSPPLDDFLKTLELDFCRNHYAITLPRIPDNLPVFDLMQILINAAKKAIRELLMRILIMVMKKILEIILNALCKALEITGELAVAAISGNGDFRNIIRNSICGDDVTDEQIDEALAKIFGALGLCDGVGASNVPSSEAIKKFITNISLVLTQGEMVELVNGTASDQTLDLLVSVVKTENPELAGCLSNRYSMKDLFNGIGSLIDKSRLNSTIAKEDMEPANPSLCATPETLRDFENLRCILLKQKGDGITDDQCADLLARAQKRALDDLQDLSTLMGMGRPDRLLSDLLPPMLSSGCSVLDGGTDGILPRDEPGTTTSAGNVVESLFDSLAVAHLQDLVGHKGFLDMVMCDSMGLGWDSHNTMVRLFGQSLTEDIKGLGFYSDDKPSEPLPGKGGGGFPSTVGLHLKDQMDTAEIKFSDDELELFYEDYDDYKFKLTYKIGISRDTPKNDYKLKLVETLGKGDKKGEKGGLKPSVLTSGGGENPIFSIAGEESLSNDAQILIETHADVGSDLPVPVSAFANFAKEKWGSNSSFDDWAAEIFPEITTGFMERFRDVLTGNKTAFDFGYSPLDEPTVHILDPEEFGGSDANPPFYLEPPVRAGWMGLADKLVPEWDGCEPRRVPLCDFEGLKNYVNDVFGKITDDERLTQNPDCVLEQPYNRILDRMSAAAIEGTIRGTLRIYICEAFLKGLVSFSLFKADFPEVFDDVLAAYIANRVEDGLIEQGRTFFGFKNLTYFYQFIEQIVQTYGRMIERGDVTPGAAELAAVENINAIQTTWKQKKSKGDREDEFIRVMDKSLNEARVILRAMLKVEIETFAGLFSDAIEPAVTSIPDLFLGSKDFIGGAISAGGPLDVASDLETSHIASSEVPFVLEKYLLIEEKVGVTENTIINRDDNLFGVVNINDWKAYLATLNLSGNIKDYFQSWKIGLRISYAPPEPDSFLTGQAANVSQSEALNTKAFKLVDGPLFPLVSVESDIGDAILSQFDVDGSYDLDCLVGQLKKSAEYEFLFRYVFPLPRFLSLWTVYAVQGFMPSLGSKKDGWVVEGGANFLGISGLRNYDFKDFDKSKHAARVLFESFINAKDFTYKDRKSRNATADLIDNLKPKSNLDTGLRGFQKRQQRSRPYDKNENLCE